MRYLSLLILVCCFVAPLVAQNPHGASLKLDCAACHNSRGWQIDQSYWNSFDPDKPSISRTTGMVWGPDTIRFHHNKTRFKLTGQHANVDCRACHESLVFNNASSDCASCHQDIHQKTVGNDCARCHTTANWIVDNTSDLHIQNGFPLTGVHRNVDCNQCHTGASALQFNPVGNSCVSCHLADFQATTNPNHQQAGFSTECETCHDVSTPGWNTDKVKHDFFPLTKGHDLDDCKKCHTNGQYSQTPNTCVACHQADFNSAQSPNHISAHFPNDCAQCHTTDPDWMPAKFQDHDVSYFPIYSGKHQGKWQQCADCHMNSANYAEFSCTNCHINPETNDAHQGVNGYIYSNEACLACHPTGDAGVAFDHNATAFPLTGAHLSVQCQECHQNGYSGTPVSCAACHTDNYNQSQNPNHAALNFPIDCAMCHTTDPGWAPATFPIHNNYYALNGAHAGIANDCATCHHGDYNNTPNTCNGCHSSDYNQTTDPNHSAQQFSTDCAGCHSETAWTPSTFDHNAVWPLTGAHATVSNDCNACHHGNYTNTPNTCNACHAADFSNSLNPNHTLLNFPTDCAMCHTTAPGWEPATFPIHNNFYTLNGAHAGISNDCAACHHGDYNNTPNTCNGCHSGDYNQTTSPNHASQQFPTDCATCHSESAWTPSSFDHNAIWPFTGAHTAVSSDCNACHHGNYTNTPNTCNACHTDDYNASLNPSHSTLNLPTDCAMCHTTAPGWEPATFPIHNNFYTLNGAHAGISNDCATCHHGDYNNTPNTCNGCHSSDYNQTTSPNHSAQMFPTDCASCHSETAWTPSTFDHNTVWPLTGAHAAISNDCNTCHHGDYTNTPNTCNGCHAPDYNQTTDPNHAAQQFSTDCTICHSTTAWTPSTFDHNTIWPLTGAHQAVSNDCNACHHGNYTNTPNTCNACHTDDYNTSLNPNHSALSLPTDCAMCHTTAPGWEPAAFPIHNNYYALNGAHANISNDCAVCHHGDYNNTPNTCNGCHAGDFNQTTDPNHVAQQFSTDCTICHSETAWAPSIFDHNSVWPLTGGHQTISSDCNACHHGNYTNTPNTCSSCHTDDYNSSVNPSHVTLNLLTDCAMCHTTAPGWAPATFPIHNSYYVLNGAHAGISSDCATCHQGDYNNTPNTCNGCHSDDYNQTTNPNHTALQFSTDCASCHSETAWSPATFDHDNAFFPIYSGTHNGVWTTCSDCHTDPNNFSVFTCTSCHTNPETDNNHNGINGYIYQSDACLACHPTGIGTNGFDHNQTGFPLTGAHQTVNCQECHVNGYAGTPTQCSACHTTDYNQSTNPNHVTLNFPTDCAMCHTTAPGWEPATFPIHNNYYPLNGAHAGIANDCATCHHGDYNNTPNTCNGCHAPDFNQTTDPNHVTQQFPTDCTICHSESAWIPSTFDHNAIYPFTGAHLTIADDCNACHQGNYTNTPTTCNACHLQDYNNSLNPDHQALGIPVDCAMCHTTAPGWEPAAFPIHNNYWALNGAHAGISNDCAACHQGDYNHTPNTCNGCHNDDFTQTTDPNHITQQFPTDCTICHSETAWTPSTFDHNSVYPFTGAHVLIAEDCNACHQGNYTNTPNTCKACHQSDYNTSTNPNHVSLNLSTDCAICHTTAPGWEPASFPVHNDFWPLNGAHAGISSDCAACHHGNYNNTPNTCNGCHMPDYNQTTDPNHITQQFPTDCTICHSETAWVPSTFDHNSVWPLTGGHLLIADDCNVCHQGNYTNTPNTCNACHMPDYNTSTNPNHISLNLPTDCAMCHTTAPDWAPATFPIHNDFWPLLGAHAGISNDCAACHMGDYNNTPNTCYGCHASDFNSATNPPHLSLGFPTNCEVCHTQNAWSPSTFHHDQQYFPIYSGSHENAWDQCADCHNMYNNFSHFTCIQCHEHSNQTQMANQHQGVSGYQYLSTACYACHPDGTH